MNSENAPNNQSALAVQTAPNVQAAPSGRSAWSRVGAAISIAFILCTVLRLIVGLSLSASSGSGNQGSPTGGGSSSGSSCSTLGGTYSLDLISVKYPSGWCVDADASRSDKLGLVNSGTYPSVFVVLDHTVSASTSAAQLLSGIGDNIRNDSNLSGVQDMGPLQSVSVGGVPAVGEEYTATWQGSNTPSGPVAIVVVVAVRGTTGVEMFGVTNLDASDPNPSQVPMSDYRQMYAGVVWTGTGAVSAPTTPTPTLIPRTTTASKLTASAHGLGSFVLTFTSDRTGISDVDITFSNFSCGSESVTGERDLPQQPPLSISSPLTPSKEFTIGVDLSTVDHLAFIGITGIFDRTGTFAFGDWTVHGQAGTICTGMWYST